MTQTHQRAEQEPDPEISARESSRRITEIGPQHVEASVGEIQHSQNTENKRQSAGDQPDEHPGGQSGQAYMNNWIASTGYGVSPSFRNPSHRRRVPFRLLSIQCVDQDQNGGVVSAPSKGGRLKHSLAGMTTFLPMILKGYLGFVSVKPQGTSYMAW